MLKIYGVPVSVHTRKVIVAATEKKLAFEIEPVIPFNPPAGWDKLSPTGKIPVLSNGHDAIADSSVICAYLERNYPEPAIYPRHTADFVRALWFEEYCDGTLFPGVVHGLFFQNIIRPNMLGEATDAAVVDGILGGPMSQMFGYLESKLNGAFLAGDAFSIADIALTSNLVNFHYVGYMIDVTRFPKLADYFARLVRETSIAAVLKAEKPVAQQMGLAWGFVDELAAA